MSWKDKPKLNRWGNPQEKPKQISGKEKEKLDSLAAATEGKEYVKGMYDDIDHYAGEPARLIKGKKSKEKEPKATSKPKLLKNKYDNPSKFGSPEYYKEMEEKYIESGMREEDYPVERKERQTLESILPKPLGEE